MLRCIFKAERPDGGFQAFLTLDLQKKLGVSNGMMTLLCSEELVYLAADICVGQSREGDHVISGSQGLRP